STLDSGDAAQQVPDCFGMASDQTPEQLGLLPAKPRPDLRGEIADGRVVWLVFKRAREYDQVLFAARRSFPTRNRIWIHRHLRAWGDRDDPRGVIVGCNQHTRVARQPAPFQIEG